MAEERAGGGGGLRTSAPSADALPAGQSAALFCPLGSTKSHLLGLHVLPLSSPAVQGIAHSCSCRTRAPCCCICTNRELCICWPCVSASVISCTYVCQAKIRPCWSLLKWVRRVDAGPDARQDAKSGGHLPIAPSSGPGLFVPNLPASPGFQHGRRDRGPHAWQPHGFGQGSKTPKSGAGGSHAC